MTDILRCEVEAASPVDADRAILRLAAPDMARLGLRPGDVAVVRGTRAAYGRCLPARPGRGGVGRVQIDLVQRGNAGLGLGDAAEVSAAPQPPEATLVRLKLSDDGQRPDASSLMRALENTPLAVGDKVRLRLAPGRVREGEVIAAEPGPVALVSARTRITLEAGAEPAPYDGIGGMEEQIARVREMIDLPLSRPDLFERLGVTPPRGVLFTGPPGSGKTLLARAVAGRIGAAFFQIDGPEIVSKHYGDSEGKLREIFSRASARAPAVIFIDEIDAIAPRRDAVSGDKQLERRVVAQLLTLLDGLAARGQVVVMAATNLPGALDPALRRPGRFDREIAFGAPDAAGRRAILQVHLAVAPLAEDVDLDVVAEECRGFVGADLAALARETAMAALARAGAEAGGSEGIDADALRLTGADFAAARRLVGPSALRDAALETPRIGWADVGGLDDAKLALTEAVIWPLRHADAFRRLGVKPSSGVLLAGPPGGGKTLLARALAGESGANFIPVLAPQLLSRYLGDAERAVEDVFARARGAAPCVLFFDELDAIAPRRDGGGDQAMARVVAQLLVEVDGISTGPGLFLLGATNRPGAIDPALLRPGRFDLVLALAPPDLAARRDILAVHARDLPLAEDVDLDAMSDATQGWSGADLRALIQGAARHALRRLARAGEVGGPDLRVCGEDVRSAFAERLASDAARAPQPEDHYVEP
jgi:transitional endoplasmic reticulum ATPase